MLIFFCMLRHYTVTIGMYYVYIELVCNMDLGHSFRVYSRASSSVRLYFFELKANNCMLTCS